MQNGANPAADLHLCLSVTIVGASRMRIASQHACLPSFPACGLHVGTIFHIGIEASCLLDGWQHTDLPKCLRLPAANDAGCICCAHCRVTLS